MLRESTEPPARRGDPTGTQLLAREALGSFRLLLHPRLDDSGGTLQFSDAVITLCPGIEAVHEKEERHLVSQASCSP